MYIACCRKHTHTHAHSPTHITNTVDHLFATVIFGCGLIELNYAQICHVKMVNQFAWSREMNLRNDSCDEWIDVSLPLFVGTNGVVSSVLMLLSMFVSLAALCDDDIRIFCCWNTITHNFVDYMLCVFSWGGSNSCMPSIYRACGFNVFARICQYRVDFDLVLFCGVVCVASVNVYVWTIASAFGIWWWLVVCKWPVCVPVCIQPNKNRSSSQLCVYV